MHTFSRNGLTFEVTDTGPDDGPVVVALHGFPQDRSSWDAVTPALTAAGYRVLAPNQRGYSPGARPGRRRDYRVALLAGDVLALVEQAGAESFHVMGHDWGAVVAWFLAARHPDRVRSLVAVSVPHPTAWYASAVRSGQLFRSWYMGLFQLPVLPERLLGARRGDRLRASLRHSGLDDRHARRYAARYADMTGPLNWYRALPLNRERLPPVDVRTLFVWSDRDGYVSRRTAELCGRWVRGPYRYEVLNGVSHWIPEQEPDRLATLVVQHLTSVDRVGRERLEP